MCRTVSFRLAGVNVSRLIAGDLMPRPLTQRIINNCPAFKLNAPGTTLGSPQWRQRLTNWSLMNQRLCREMEVCNSRRRIGQESFGFAQDSKSVSTLDALSKVIDWAATDRRLTMISSAAKGEPAWPPLALFKALLLAVWYDLSDVKLAEALDDRSSFRRFCGSRRQSARPLCDFERLWSPRASTRSCLTGSQRN